eukprot:TRINITY_DN240_c3_g2_i1.p1 TRINITY_DN240_c3_g2~~TRINITY_DN240_c3_g2_i1.p1  ORF type:complete len:318 (+),score=45.52 TRINITY_DN240_c3_g2_i1:78-956(+)
MPHNILRATTALALAWQSSGKQCEAFWNAMGTCAIANEIISCDAGCPEKAMSLIADRENEVDCENLDICNSTVSTPTGALRYCTAHNCLGPSGDLFPWHRPSAPLKVLTTIKCPSGGGQTEIKIPCLGGNQPIVYFSVDIHQTSGFEYEVYSEDGGPTGLMEVFNINDVQTDEIMDCFSKDTEDTATCQNSKISRGFQLPDSVKFDPSIKIHFGFKSCSAPEPLPSCQNRLVFRTAPKKKSLPTDTATHGCTSAVIEVPPSSVTQSLCVDSESAGALTVTSVILLVLVSLLQ